jgi:hypothetical protein
MEGAVRALARPEGRVVLLRRRDRASGGAGVP